MTLVKLLTMIAEMYVHVIKGRGLGYDLSGNTIHLTFRNLHVATQNARQPAFYKKKKLNIGLIVNPQVFPKVTSPITCS
jgi:hypothetical protein